MNNNAYSQRPRVSFLERVQQSESIRIWNLDVEARKRRKDAARNARRAMNRHRDELRDYPEATR